MSSATDAAVAQAKQEATIKAAFDKFMSSETTKLMVSMVPPTEPRELLVTLLRSAFETGATTGMAVTMQSLFDGFVSAAKKAGEL
jgi:hypothetical protein